MRTLLPLALLLVAAPLACRDPGGQRAAPPAASQVATVPDAEAGVVAVELAEVVVHGAPSEWSGSLFGLHAVGDAEAYVSYGVHLGRVTRERVAFDGALSRGLPVQSDPCVAPAIEELHRESSGRLVLLLRDGGTPHFTGGCLDRAPTGLAFAWMGERWVKTPTPPWAQSESRATFAETRVAGKVVRLVGPHVAPTDDGWNPPSAYEHLPVCFGKDRPVLTGWDPPAGLAALPADLCVEGLSFGASAADALLFGRTRDGAMWLERRSPGAPPVRTRVAAPAGCATRSSHSRTHLTGASEGELQIHVSCNQKPADTAGWTGRTLSFHYGSTAGALVVTPTGSKDDDLRPPAVEPSVRDLGHGYRAQSGPGGRDKLLHDGALMLDAFDQVEVLGGFALAEKSGHVLLLGPQTSPPPSIAKLEAYSAPEGRFLSLSDAPPQCDKGFFWFHRLPADAAAQGALDKTHATLTALVKEHSELAAGPEHFVEVRIGDELFVGRHWAGAWSAAKGTTSLVARATDWARAKELNPGSACLLVYPTGDGRTFRIDASGQTLWVDRNHAVLVEPGAH